jgi:uncharacterized membrane protein YcjF (UPF0283 family)
MPDPGSRRRLDWLDLLAGVAAVIVILLFVLSFLHEWVASAPGSPIATPI